MLEIKYDKPPCVCFDEEESSEGTRNFCSDFVCVYLEYHERCFPKVAGSGIPDPSNLDSKPSLLISDASLQS